jgi:hypothetical protein
MIDIRQTTPGKQGRREITSKEAAGLETFTILKVSFAGPAGWFG